MSIKLTSGHVVSCCFSTLKKNKKFKSTKTKKTKSGHIVKNNKGTTPYQKREANSECVQA